MSFSALIEERRDEIVQRWEARSARVAREDGIPGPTTSAAQRQRIAQLLGRIGEGLRSAPGRTAQEPSPARDPRPRPRHGTPALAADARHAIRDYVILRDAIFDAAEEAGVTPAYRELRILLDAIATEITADALLLAESERELFFRTIPDLLCVAGFDGHFLRVNPSFHFLLGWTEEELLSRPILEFVHPDDRERTRQEIERIAGGVFTMHFENRYLVKGGGHRLLSWVARPVMGRGFMYAVARDVTESRRYEQEREATLTALQRTAQFRERFLGIVAHDLRTPLASIVTGAQVLLRMAGMPERGARIARRIDVTAQRTSKMIDDLMDFSRVRLGAGIPIERATVDLAGIVRQVADETCAVYPGRSVIFLEREPFPGRWDGGRLAQLVGNLIKNALDYSPPNSTVGISLTRDGEEVCLEVRNRNLDGPISDAHARELFEPFYKGGIRRKEGKGLGLGLYIANEIVKAHGGTISVHSDAQTGTCFSVRLPTG
ncbi:MAG TPA: PAS domain-containing sensor histidine kinase [Vulgatibacter sp.]|nr:PAS domain-containing sensor histidine kinase [Vulgatibacter sp.]